MSESGLIQGRPVQSPGRACFDADPDMTMIHASYKRATSGQDADMTHAGSVLCHPALCFGIEGACLADIDLLGNHTIQI